MNEPYDIIQTVRLTEKATLLSEKREQVRLPRPPATRTRLQIKQAIEKLFKKTVVAVNTCNYAGKKKRERTAAFGRKAALEEGDRDPEGRRQDRTRLNRRLSWHSKLSVHSRRPTASRRSRRSTRSRSRSRRSRWSRPRRRAAAATTTAGSLRVTSAAVTSRSTGSSTSSAGSAAVAAEVIGIEYDPNRTARIALIQYADGEKSLHPRAGRFGRRRQGDRWRRCRARNRNALPLKSIPLGTAIHNIELTPGRGGQIARSAGQQVILNNREGGLRAGEASVRRNPQDPRELLRDDRPGRQCRSHERVVAARRDAAAGRAVVRPCAAWS